MQIKDFLRDRAIKKSELNKKQMLKCPTDVSKVGRCIGLLRTWEANVVCLSETQTAWEIPKITSAVAKEVKRMDRYGGIIGSSSNIATSSVVKPGGSAMVWDGNWGSRIIEKGTDPYKMGRWSYIKINGRNKCKLSIFTVYRCCNYKKKCLKNMTSSYSQQITMLKQRGIKKPPQEQILKDLKESIKKHQDDGCEILVCIDANEQWEDQGSGIEDFALTMGLADIAREKYNGNYPPTFTRANTNRRIDFLLGSEEVLNNVVAHGMAPLSMGRSIGDHRAQYVDLNVKNLLHLNPHDNTVASSRRLKSPDPKCVNKYIESIEKHFKAHRVYDRLRSLLENLQNKSELSTDNKAEYEKLDEDIFRLCRSAENEIKLSRHQKYVWSPVLDSAYKMSNYWKLRIEKMGNGKATNKLLKLSKFLGVNDNDSKTVKEIKILHQAALKHLRKIRIQAKEKRIEFLHSLAEKYAQENNMSKHKAIIEILSHEEIREMYQHIRVKLHGQRQPQLSEVWIKDAEGKKIVLTESEDVEYHLLERNRNHLRQASDTPFADGPLGAMIQWDGSGELADRLVNGDPLPDMAHLDSTIQAYMEGMAASRLDIINSIQISLSLDKYRDFWQKKRENTATSPFGLHIGHFKSVLHPDHHHILDIHRHMMVIPFQYGYVPKRWAQTVQIMLEKDKGTPWTHRLRIIELFDSQLNAGMQIFFGKQMVYKALEMGQIHQSAYGSVPQRTAQDAIVEKIISLDLMRVLKLSGAIFDCDAKGCYDRIIPALQSIFSRRLGIPIRTAMFFATLWNGCKHFVRTRFGVSADFYAGTFEAALFGIGQGNGAGPAFWLSHLIVMFCVLDTLTHGMQFHSPSRKTKHKSPGMGFVDDVTLGCTNKFQNKTNDKEYLNQDEGTTVLQQITENAQHWEKMLYADGGRLELKKCYWICITWKWINGIATLRSNQNSNLTMNLWQSEAKETVVIDRKSTNDAPKVLGCHVAVDGTWKKEVGIWKLEATRFGTKVKNAGFNRTCGSKLYPTIWLPKLRYISPAVCFTKTQSDDIDRPVVRHCLSATGFSQRFPRVVVFGPTLLGGLQWETCYSTQTYEKIKFFLGHTRRKDRLGSLLQILMQSVQLAAGIEAKILQTTIPWTQWVESTWLSFLQQNLWDIGGELVVGHECYKPPRINDKFLMDIFYRTGYKKKELRILNRCRIYLRVLTLSDIATYDGKMISQKLWQMESPRESAWDWPLQILPKKSDRNLWMQAIRDLVENNGEIKTVMGKWQSKSHQIWKYMVTKSRSEMMRYENGNQKRLVCLTHSRFSKTGPDCYKIKTGVPIQCATTAVGYKEVDNPHKYTTATLEHTIFSPTNKAQRTLLDKVHYGDIVAIKKSWETGKDWRIGTDGGLKGGIGTIGVTVTDSITEEELLTVKSAETCGHHHLHSTREELRAQLAAEVIINECGKHWGRDQKRNIQLVCDNRSTVNILKQDIPTTTLMDPHVAEIDIILSINELKRVNENVNRTYSWVSSHQEEDEYEHVEVRINDRADELATETRENVEKSLQYTYPKQFFEGAQAMIKIDGSFVTKDLKNSIHKALYQSNLEDFLIGKYNWAKETFANIDWKSMESSLNGTQGLAKTTIIKMMHRWQPTNSYVQRNDRRPVSDAKCHVCDQTDDQWHYLSCKSTHFTEARAHAWCKFCSQMKKYRHLESFLRIIWIGIQNWIYRDFTEALPQSDEVSDQQYQILVQAYHHQADIGWNHFFVGRISKTWTEYYATTIPEDKMKQGKLLAFGKKMVEAAWHMSLDIWKSHNGLVHGDGSGLSTQDIKAIHNCVTELYTEKQKFLNAEDEWLFDESERIKHTRPIPQLMGWIERVLACIPVEQQKDIEVFYKAQHILHRMCMSSIFA